MFDIIDPSNKSFVHVERAFKIAEEIGIDFQNFYVVGGYRFPETLDAEVKKRISQEFLGRIAYDKEVEEFSMSGKSLLELSSESPAYISLRKIMKKAGYH